MIRILILLVLSFNIFAHGSSYKIIKGGSVGFYSEYSDGSPMNFCKVKVKDPTGKAFQEGRTDKNGYFFFRPTTVGTWHASVDDEMGHLKKIYLKIKDLDTGEVIENKDAPMWMRTLMGISTLFGLFGIATLYRRKKS